MTTERNPMGRNGLLRVASATLVAGVVAISGIATASSQDATPASPNPVVVSDMVITNVDGETVAFAGIRTVEDGVAINVFVNNLEMGEYGLSIHETGVCDPGGTEPYSSAGGHFNPTDASHGPGPVTTATPAIEESHAGDLGNVVVGEGGTGSITVVTTRVSLSSNADHALNDEDGSAFIVHQNADDLMTDPSGNSGPRIACGVIFPPQNGTPVTNRN